MSNVLLKNIGTIISGDIEKPVLEGNMIFIEDGIIHSAGFLDIKNAEDRKSVV